MLIIEKECSKNILKPYNYLRILGTIWNARTYYKIGRSPPRAQVTFYPETIIISTTIVLIHYKCLYLVYIHTIYRGIGRKEKSWKIIHKLDEGRRMHNIVVFKIRHTSDTFKEKEMHDASSFGRNAFGHVPLLSLSSSSEEHLLRATLATVYRTRNRYTLCIR